jgi:hypothetical protein
MSLVITGTVKPLEKVLLVERIFGSVQTIGLLKLIAAPFDTGLREKMS